MKPILVLYATREGQTQRIAEHIDGRLRASGIPCELINVKYVPAGFSLIRYRSAILAASVHVGKHQREMVNFVRKNRQNLEDMRTALVSVSLSQAGVQDPNSPPDQRLQAAADVEKLINVFILKTQWKPTHVKSVAGALMYSKYNFFVRFIMKQIAGRAGASTDTSRDHEFTDWVAVDRFVSEFIGDRQSN
jgi:menaquinone-dependent protoporphyrinogen oxidase